MSRKQEAKRKTFSFLHKSLYRSTLQVNTGTAPHYTLRREIWFFRFFHTQEGGLGRLRRGRGHVGHDVDDLMMMHL